MSTGDQRTATPLRDISDIRARYQQEGLHTTVVMPLMSGEISSERAKRARHICGQLAVDPATVDNLNLAFAAASPCGSAILASATSKSAAFATLPLALPLAQSTTTVVSDLPALLPLVEQISFCAPVIGALIDRVGADIFYYRSGLQTALETVEGKHDQQDAQTIDGARREFKGQPRKAWLDNTDLVAGRLSHFVRRLQPHAMALSGDDLAIRQTLGQVSDPARQLTRQVAAGERLDPDSAARMATAVFQLLQEMHEDDQQDALYDLYEELGVEASSAVGFEAVGNAARQDLVETLFVPAVHSEDLDVDRLISRVLRGGGNIQVVKPTEIPGGPAALLRALP